MSPPPPAPKLYHITHLDNLESIVREGHLLGDREMLSSCNAGARYAEFRSSRDHLHDLDWDAIAARDFRDRDTKERKQAEFLVHERFPFALIERIGVRSEAVARAARRSLMDDGHRPPVEVLEEWYF